MSLFGLEHSRTAYRIDFALYTAASAAMASALLLASPAGLGWALLLWVLLGGALWTLAEYGLHRFVLHGLAPFKHWHAEHHRRPAALIASPVLVSVTLFALLSAVPAWWLLGAWPACALTFGLVTGYLVYGLAHHAMHHALRTVPGWRGWGRPWLIRRRAWHALHHARQGSHAGAGSHFGVSSGLWDQVFGTAHRSRLRRNTRPADATAFRPPSAAATAGRIPSSPPHSTRSCALPDPGGPGP